MALTIDTTVGGSSSNSYASIVEIDAFVETNPHDTTWTAKTEEQKKGYAITATRLLMELFRPYGYRTDNEQALDFPRTGLFDREGNDVDYTIVPQFIKNAQAEYSRLIAEEDLTSAIEGGDVQSEKVDVISTTYFPPVSRKAWEKKALPDSVWSILRDYGQRIVDGSGDAMASVIVLRT